MLRKKLSENQVQVCKCGGIHLCFGNVSINMKKREFMEMAAKIEQAKDYVTKQFHQETSGAPS